MNNYVLFSITLVLIVLLFVVIFGFAIIDASCNQAPDVTDVQSQFLDNYDSIEIVVDYMVNSGYEKIYIKDTLMKALLSNHGEANS